MMGAGITDRRPPFRFSAFTRVGFSDTDAQAVVYYGRYMPYFDLAKTEYHRLLGQFMQGSDRQQFVMRSANVEYHAPARFDDLLEVFVRVARIGRTSLTYEFAAYGVEGDVRMTTATQTIVLIEVESRMPTPIPEAVRSTIASFEGDGLETAG